MKQSNETPWNTMKHHETEQWNTLKQHEADSMCIIAMKQCVSWPWHTVSFWFIVIQGVSWPWNTLYHPDSRCFMTVKQIVSGWLIWFNLFHHCFTSGNGHVSCWFNLFHHCFTSVNGHASFWFNLFHHCFITVSPVGTSFYTFCILLNLRKMENGSNFLEIKTIFISLVDSEFGFPWNFLNTNYRQRDLTLEVLIEIFALQKL